MLHLARGPGASGRSRIEESLTGGRPGCQAPGSHRRIRRLTAVPYLLPASGSAILCRPGVIPRSPVRHGARRATVCPNTPAPGPTASPVCAVPLDFACRPLIGCLTVGRMWAAPALEGPSPVSRHPSEWFGFPVPPTGALPSSYALRLRDGAARTTGAMFAGIAAVSLLVGSRVLEDGFGWPNLISSNAIVTAVAVASGVALVFGSYPARHAASLDPIEALRAV